MSPQKSHRTEECMGIGIVDKGMVIGVFEQMLAKACGFGYLPDRLGDTAEEDEFRSLVQTR